MLTFYKLKWMHKRARAPLCFEDVQPPVASANKGIVRQRPALEPVMVWKLLEAFTEKNKCHDKSVVQAAVAVVSAFTPIRYAHVNRSVPLWKNDVVAVFWAFRDKKRQADGSRRGFAWHVVMILPEVKQAVGILWRAWHSLAKRDPFKEEVPSFLSYNFWTGQPVGTAEFNKF